jgi:ribosomal subunit interface protein
MPFRVSGKNIDIGQALRARVNARVAEVTAKYFDGGFSGHVTIGKEGFGFRTDCVVHLDSGIVLEADALAADAYASADQAALRLEKRLRRYKHRLKDHQMARAQGAVHLTIAHPIALQPAPRAMSLPRPSTTAKRRRRSGTQSSSPNRRPP